MHFPWSKLHGMQNEKCRTGHGLFPIVKELFIMDTVVTMRPSYHTDLIAHMLMWAFTLIIV